MTRVLVIDDDAPIRLLCRVNLEAERMEVSEIPIVFLTARAELGDRARGLEIGGIDYLTKPFNPVELAGQIRELLERVRRGERDELRQQKLARLRSMANGD